MSLIKKLADLANSPKGKELTEKAKKIANDPETRQKIDAAKRKLTDKRGGSAGHDRASGPPAPPSAGGTAPPSAGGTAPPGAGAGTAGSNDDAPGGGQAA